MTFFVYVSRFPILWSVWSRFLSVLLEKNENSGQYCWNKFRILWKVTKLPGLVAFFQIAKTEILLKFTGGWKLAAAYFAAKREKTNILLQCQFQKPLAAKTLFSCRSNVKNVRANAALQKTKFGGTKFVHVTLFWCRIGHFCDWGSHSRNYIHYIIMIAASLGVDKNF